MESINRLLEIMKTLRDPEHGCPWDKEQGFSSIAPYTIEEAYEVADAIERNDMGDLCAELGDLLFQVVYHAQIAEEKGSFNFEDIVDGIIIKLLQRHPHVFGDKQIDNAKAQPRAWERFKVQEREIKLNGKYISVIDGVILNMPSLSRAQKIQSRAATVGFDWKDTQSVLEKVNEEITELRRELSDRPDKTRVMEELGDLLFTCVNLARHMDIDAEAALRSANYKFETRFRYIEDMLSEQNKRFEDVSLEELDKLWEAAKIQKTH